MFAGWLNCRLCIEFFLSLLVVSVVPDGHSVDGFKQLTAIPPQTQHRKSDSLSICRKFNMQGSLSVHAAALSNVLQRSCDDTVDEIGAGGGFLGGDGRPIVEDLFNAMLGWIEQNERREAS